MSKLLRVKFPLLTPIMISFFAGVLLGIAWLIRLGTSGESLFGLLSFLIFTGMAFGMLLVYPLILTVMELGVFVAAIRRESLPAWTKGLDCITVGLGMLYSLLYVSVVGSATFGSDWDVVLSNAAKHTPIYSQSMPTICVIITHEMRFAREVANRVFYMDEGGIYEEGPPEQVFQNPVREKTRRFIRRL